MWSLSIVSYFFGDTLFFIGFSLVEVEGTPSCPVPTAAPAPEAEPATITKASQTEPQITATTRRSALSTRRTQSRYLLLYLL